MNFIYLYPTVTFLVSMLVTLFSMPALLRFCKERGLFDMPNDRKVHHNKIPRLGGVLFAPALTLGMAASLGIMMCMHQNLMPVGLSTLLLFTGMFMIFIIGLMDDLLGLGAQLKFSVQLAASLFMPLCNLYINNLYGFCGIYEIPVWVGYPLTVLISLLIINAVNLIDGIDGLASGLGVLALLTYSYIFIGMDNVAYSMFTCGLLGTVLVFMYYNLFGNPEMYTKTFMGDTGSLILGYSLAYLSIKFAMFNPSVLPVRECPILLSYTLVIVPVFDLVRVALFRLKNGKGIFTPDKTHIHHLFLATGMNMRQTLICILLLQVVMVTFNCVGFYCLGISSTVVVLADILIYGLLVAFLYHKQQKLPAA